MISVESMTLLTWILLKSKGSEELEEGNLQPASINSSLCAKKYSCSDGISMLCSCLIYSQKVPLKKATDHACIVAYRLCTITFVPASSAITISDGNIHNLFVIV